MEYSEHNGLGSEYPEDRSRSFPPLRNINCPPQHLTNKKYRNLAPIHIPVASHRPTEQKKKKKIMALKAVRVSDVPNLDQIPENASLAFSNGPVASRIPKFLVIGHRGNGMNAVQSSDNRMRAIKENSILSFNTAAKFPLDFVEFDVQVTRDGYPVIFHDDFILTQDGRGTVLEKRVTELCLSEFLCYGNSLLRKNKDGQIVRWQVEKDDYLCTLQEVFEKVEPNYLGFNIEIKFDDYIVYQEDYLIRVLQSILQVVFEHAGDRPIIFSTFQPDAALLVKKLLHNTYPVFFLTNGGNEIYYDARRNSLDEAMRLCVEGGLEGIVSEVEAVFRNPGVATKIKDSKLSLLTYGKLNNVAEAVYMQHLMGIEGVIVDFVQEITEAVCDMIKPSAAAKDDGDGGCLSEGDGKMPVKSKPQFSQRELSFVLKFIPELIQL